MLSFNRVMFVLALTVLALGLLVTARAHSASDARSVTLRPVLKLYEAFDTGKLALLDQAVAADYVDHMPLPGVPQGRVGLKRTVAIFRAGLPDLRSTIETTVVEGDLVVTRLTITGTHLGNFLGVPATGKTIRFAGLDVHRVRNGRVVESWHVEDLLGALGQLGVVPTAK